MCYTWKSSYGKSSFFSSGLCKLNQKKHFRETKKRPTPKYASFMRFTIAICTGNWSWATMCVYGVNPFWFWGAWMRSSSFWTTRSNMYRHMCSFHRHILRKPPRNLHKRCMCVWMVFHVCWACKEKLNLIFLCYGNIVCLTWCHTL